MAFVDLSFKFFSSPENSPALSLASRHFHFVGKRPLFSISLSHILIFVQKLPLFSINIFHFEDIFFLINHERKALFFPLLLAFLFRGEAHGSQSVLP